MTLKAEFLQTSKVTLYVWTHIMFLHDFVTGQSLLSCFRAKLLSCLIFPKNVKKLVLYHFYQVTNHNFSIFISPNKIEILFDISSLKTLELQGFSQVCQSEKT